MKFHREHQREQAADAHSLCDALTALYAYFYDVPADDARLAARGRVDAMAISDQWVSDGCRLEDPALIAEQRRSSAPTPRYSRQYTDPDLRRRPNRRAVAAWSA
jgi:hypothetical protein